MWRLFWLINMHKDIYVSSVIKIYAPSSSWRSAFYHLSLTVSTPEDLISDSILHSIFSVNRINDAILFFSFICGCMCGHFGDHIGYSRFVLLLPVLTCLGARKRRNHSFKSGIAQASRQHECPLSLKRVRLRHFPVRRPAPPPRSSPYTFNDNFGRTILSFSPWKIHAGICFTVDTSSCPSAKRYNSWVGKVSPPPPGEHPYLFFWERLRSKGTPS